jgi:hypothetical protein
MKLKYFVEKETKQHMAVNPNTVYAVKETGYGTTICFVNDVYITVTESYLEVVAKLNEV